MSRLAGRARTPAAVLVAGTPPLAAATRAASSGVQGGTGARCVVISRRRGQSEAGGVVVQVSGGRGLLGGSGILPSEPEGPFGAGAGKWRDRGE